MKKICGAILSDGASGKDDGLGSYGNGHLTAFVFSGIRYILYAGVSEQGKLASGHTILASHKVGDERYGKDGFIATGFRSDDDSDYSFDYYPIERFASTLIADVMEKISTENEYGSAVIIPAFSIDEKRESIASQIKRYASLHFFPAILEGKLSISYEGYDSKKLAITSDNVRDVAKEFGGESRSRGLRGGPKGRYIYEGVNTYVSSHEAYIETKTGKIKCFLRKSSESRSNINIFRDGMWITDTIGALDARYFANFKPFDLVINVSKKDDSVLYDLIRSSEGSLHMHLDKRVGHEDKWEKLRKFWPWFREELKNHLIKETYDEISFDDFASIDVKEHESVDNHGTAPIGKWKRGKTTFPPPPPPPDDPDPNEYFEILGEQAEINGQAIRDGDALRAHIKSKHDVPYPELRIAEVLGADDACDSSGDWRFSDLNYCEIETIKVNNRSVNLAKGRGIRKRPSATGENGVFAVRLNAVKKNELIQVQVMFKSSLGDPRSTVKLEIVKRAGRGIKRG